MGRKQEFKNPRAISARVEEEEFKQLEEIRWRERLDITEVVRIAIQEYIRSHAVGNTTFKLENWANNPDFKISPTVHADRKQWMPFLQDLSISERQRYLAQFNNLKKMIVMSGPLK